MCRLSICTESSLGSSRARPSGTMYVLQPRESRGSRRLSNRPVSPATQSPRSRPRGSRRTVAARRESAIAGAAACRRASRKRGVCLRPSRKFTGDTRGSESQSHSVLVGKPDAVVSFADFAVIAVELYDVGPLDKSGREPCLIGFDAELDSEAALLETSKISVLH
jgi:hypothetical protein